MVARVTPAELAAVVEAHRAATWSGWGYHARVSVPHRYVTIAVPKVACSTVKRTLHTFEGQSQYRDRWWATHEDSGGLTLLDHPTDLVVEMLTSPEFLRFCFVRNPYSRLFSAWKSKLGCDDEQYEVTRNAIREEFDYPTVDGTRVGTVSFRDSIEYLLDPATSGHLDDHWTLQTQVLTYDTIDFEVVGRFENFVDDFAAILKRLKAPPDIVALGSEVTNPTAPMALAAVYDSALASRVHDHYAGDFEAFGYEADSWRFL